MSPHRFKSTILTVIITMTTIGIWSNARAQLLATPTEVCKSAPILTNRRTIVYVDVASVPNATEEWGLTILHRLELTPRETLTVLAVNPNTFEVREVFDSCLPILSPNEINNVQQSRGLWDHLTSLDPVAQQRENLQTFNARLGNALDAILAIAKKYQEGARRNVLGAIAFDKNRYVDPKAYYRVIIYTDGTIKDADVQSKTSASGPSFVDALIDQYRASFFGAEVAVYGVNGGGQSGNLEQKEQLFAGFFLKNWAHLKSFSASLPQQDNQPFPQTLRMDGTFEGGGTKGALKLAIFTPKQGDGTDGWLAFNVGRETLYVPFHGEFHCGADDCHLNATCDASIPPQSTNPYFRVGDQILLSGKPGALEGSLQAAGREVFTGGGNQNVSYALKFPSRQ